MDAPRGFRANQHRGRNRGNFTVPWNEPPFLPLLLPPPLALSFPSVRLFFTFAPRFALLIYRANRAPLSLSLSWVSGDYYVVTGSSGRN